MPHHFTKGTVQASVWCNRCRKDTAWRIADGRRQFCTICYNRPVTAKEKEQKEKQPSLFGEA